MRRLVLCFAFVLVLVQPVFALEFEAPEAPQSAQEHLPKEQDSFSNDLWYIIRSALSTIMPSVAESSKICVSLVAVVLLVSVTETLNSNIKSVTNLVGTLAASTLLMNSANTLIHMGTDTVTEITQYGKLLLPVMTAALAAQGGVSSSGALYAGTAFFGAGLASLVKNIAVPLLYVYLCLSIANSAVGEKVLKDLRDFSKWAITWTMKIVLYVFTGYMTVTGVVSGSADASAVKATKLAISGAVPVVGSIISDASEAILVSAGVMKSSAGIYGILTVVAICIGPFLRIGVQYLMLKITAAVCSVFGSKGTTGLLKDFSTGMRLILAMTGTVCLLHLISTVCFMKGVG